MPAKSPVANLLWLKERSRRMRRSLPPSLHRYHCTHPEKFMGDALVELLCRSDSGRLGMALMKIGRFPEAVEAGKRATELRPNDQMGFVALLQSQRRHQGSGRGRDKSQDLVLGGSKISTG